MSKNSYFLLLILLILFLPYKISAQEIYLPDAWECDFSNLYFTDQFGTQVGGLRKYTDTLYCSSSLQMCWEIDTGFSWSWDDEEGNIYSDPSLLDNYDENYYDFQYKDLSSEFIKYFSYYDDDQCGELDCYKENKRLGLWELSIKTGDSNICEIKNGVKGSLFNHDGDNYCSYSMHV